MPVYSMTGYASASSQPSTPSENAVSRNAENTGASNPIGHAAHTAVTVELRSVNGRFLDLGFRMPEDLRGLEPALRELLTGKLKRGKVELRINTQRDSEGSWPQPQADQLNRLSRLEGTVQNWLPKAQPLSVHEALQWCKGGGAASEKLDEPAMDAARRCVDGLLEAREREGEKLVAILMERVSRLRELADAAEPMLPAIVQRQQQRFLERWQEALASTGAAQTIPEENLKERALNEAAAYAIRIDVAEELARLRAHLEEIARLLKKGGEIGKRLDFLIQELHREANTLGSKAAALELTNISVEMKVAVEQLREQVQNIE
ncbi:YicC/YloC family endoribonuclease [Roseateles oligotrophus]|uniref:YicC family protein n=1 Tax=Roseateles oligotrophus TaxID=1769250 RepID=A0ABT2YA97_9BURK|nr:YicC/YloC family endoribonuclease [Roseateles oligotrophus]MCV2367221.1 YicC family protein [Roseateles oligotrophus]